MERKIKIGIIDDHKIFLDGIVSVLSTEENFELVFHETNPLEALKKVNNKTDIILTDISMPEINGLEFIKQVKKKIPSIKILVISMFKNIHKINDIDGYVLKEIDKDYLIQIIKSIVIFDKKYLIENNTKQIAFEFNKSILSEREKQIIRLIANEHTTDEIAEILFISKGTVETHRKNIFVKLQIKNIAGLVKTAIYLGIV